MSAEQLSDRPVFRVAVAATSAIAGISGLAMAALILFNPPVYWFMLGFEVLITVAAVFGVLLSLGRFRDGPALALLCIAGAVGAGGLLGYVGSGKTLVGIDLKYLLVLRAALAAAFALAAAAVVLARRPRASLPLLATGIGAGVALVALGAGFWAARGTLAGAAGPVRVIAFTVAGVLVICLVSAAGHYLIRAFAIADESPEPGQAGA